MRFQSLNVVGISTDLISREQHVLYLMIVNMPTDEQLRAVAEVENCPTLPQGKH